MGRTRTTYDKEFKMMAVNLCHTGKTATQVAMELGIRSELVSLWKREYETNKKGSEHLFQERQQKHEFIKSHQKKFAVEKMCKVLGVGELAPE